MIIQAKAIETIITNILCLITFVRNSWLLCDNVKKYVRARQDTDDNMTQCMGVECWIQTHVQNM